MSICALQHMEENMKCDNCAWIAVQFHYKCTRSRTYEGTRKPARFRVNSASRSVNDVAHLKEQITPRAISPARPFLGTFRPSVACVEGYLATSLRTPGISLSLGRVSFMGSCSQGQGTGLLEFLFELLEARLRFDDLRCEGAISMYRGENLPRTRRERRRTSSFFFSALSPRSLSCASTRLLCVGWDVSRVDGGDGQQPGQ